MKTYSAYTIIAVCLIAATACSDNQPAEIALHKATFRATTGSTRTALGSDGSVSWLTTDRLSVFDAQGNHQFSTTDEGEEANFTGEVADASTYYALYPYQADASLNTFCDIHALVPYDQTATSDGFDGAANLSVGVSKAKEASFRMMNVCGLVRFTIPDDLGFAVKKVVLHSHCGEQLAGHVYITADTDSVPQYSSGTATGDSIATSITLSATGGADIAAGTYNIACLPQTLDYGFSITLIDATGAEHMKTTNKRTVIRRSRILNLGPIDSFNFEAVDLGDGLLWANVNLGADKPEEYGNYYAWGETKPKEVYDRDTYKHCFGTTITKYNASDGLTILQEADDAAHVYLGGKWRVPTYADYNNLTIWAASGQATLNGVKGYQFTGFVTGKTIFLPNAGRVQQITYHEQGTNGAYWLSNLDSNNSMATFVSITTSSRHGPDPRFYGKSIRAVRPK
ncbi:MAG: hypothetical protein IKR18_07235 [Bacteroidaceae bacterium]|nr:hypothetical protein [Bacteroidaceae bacterium]